MKTFGIVCEWNPFHNGHARLLLEARKRGAECIVCVMSGSAVQRGELAVADPYTRAEIAVRCGADLVLTLPYPWSSASAEGFADAAISILSDYVDTVLFGSECGDITRLRNAAACAEGEEFQSALAARMIAGEGAAAAYFGELAARGFSPLSSNDMLGIEYIRAAKRQALNLAFDTVKREGASYREPSLGGETCPSATALRPLLLKMNPQILETLSQYMPSVAVERLQEDANRGMLTDFRLLERAILAFFRLHEPSDFDGIAELGGGLAERICACARDSATYDGMMEALKTKRYTDGRLRRGMLFAMTGVKSALITERPAYTTLLAMNEQGRALLAKTRKTRQTLLVTKPADAPRDTAQFCASEKLEALVTLARATPTSMGTNLKKGAYCEKNPYNKSRS